MIVIKTRMRTMPVSCHVCPFYRPRGDNPIYDRACCGAKITYSKEGKPINPWNKERYKTTKERPTWCPLEEGYDD